MSNKNYIAFNNGAHDHSISIYSEEFNKLYCLEYERLFGIRYFKYGLEEHSKENQIRILSYIKQLIDNLGFQQPFEIGFFSKNDNNVPNFGNSTKIITEFFNCNNIEFIDHHKCHAANAFYTSPFEEALIFSFDGCGNDGNFAVFEASKNKIIKINETDTKGFSFIYDFIAQYVKEVSFKNEKKNLNILPYAGKLMGISAYGKYNQELHEKFFNLLKNYHENFNDIHFFGLKKILGKNYFSSNDQLDLAYNVQLAFENYFIEIFDHYIKEKNYKNICLSGGCALNVLLNEKLSKKYPQLNFYISPNPNDSGLSLGALSAGLNKKIKDEIMYCGIPVLDEEILPHLLMYRSAVDADPKLIAKEIYEGKIIGICRNGSEVGPRALGNRSILANPCLFNIKDDLNKKVKFREWYRPFAPICIEERAKEFFETSDNVSYKYMSFAPKVRTQYQKFLPSITHIDGSSRLQTINENQNSYIYNILKEFEKLSGYPILVNTSFNIKGKPILTHYQAALQNLDSTQMDGVVLGDYYISKE